MSIFLSQRRNSNVSGLNVCFGVRGISLRPAVTIHLELEASNLIGDESASYLGCQQIGSSLARSIRALRGVDSAQTPLTPPGWAPRSSRRGKQPERVRASGLVWSPHFRFAPLTHKSTLGYTRPLKSEFLSLTFFPDPLPRVRTSGSSWFVAVSQRLIG